MSVQITVKGPRASHGEPKLLHIEIHAHPAGRPDRPMYRVLHVHDVGEPHVHDFSDGTEMLTHLANHVPGMPEPEGAPPEGTDEHTGY